MTSYTLLEVSLKCPDDLAFNGQKPLELQDCRVMVRELHLVMDGIQICLLSGHQVCPGSVKNNQNADRPKERLALLWKSWLWSPHL